MVFLISLILTALLIASGRNFLKKHAAVCYVLAAAISAAVVVCTATGASAAFPAWVRSWIWPIFARSALSTALFVKGYEDAVDFWRETGDFEMILVLEDGQIALTEGLEDQFSPANPSAEEVLVIRHD